jgi:hypothetical protein
MSEYYTRLHAAKTRYPFARWAGSIPELYTESICAAFARVFDNLIAKLVALGETASEAEKLHAFHDAVRALNELNQLDLGLIETGERDDLCELCNVVARAAGLDPSKYGNGAGPADDWREW